MDIGSDVYSLSVENQNLLVGIKHYFNALTRVVNDTQNIYETMDMVKKNRGPMEQKMEVVIGEILEVEGVLVQDFKNLNEKLDAIEKKLS